MYMYCIARSEVGECRWRIVGVLLIGSEAICVGGLPCHIVTMCRRPTLLNRRPKSMILSNPRTFSRQYLNAPPNGFASFSRR